MKDFSTLAPFVLRFVWKMGFEFSLQAGHRWFDCSVLARLEVIEAVLFVILSYYYR